ncbi:MAG: hypothetical protein GY838_03005 [bacterium]|nr:hypothetical protein [bacterium]
MALGGPIKKDLMWFFAGIEFGRSLEFDPYDDPNLPGQKKTTWDNYDLKLTPQLGDNHRVNVRAGDHEYLGPDAGGALDERTTWSESYQHDKMWAADLSSVLSDSTFLEVRAGSWNGDSANRPPGTDLFQLLAQRVQRVGDGYSVACTCYIATEVM